jgi:hypothetical protein
METIEDVTDEHILKSLLIKRDKLLEELKRLNYELHRLNVAIDIYQPKSNGSVADKKPNAEQLDKGEYSLSFTAVQQLHYALRHLGPTTLLDAANYIYENDNRLDIVKLRKRLTDIASLEYRNNRINGYKSQGRFIYSLKEKE